MVARCTNPKKRAYALYGGRGIRVCDRWRVFDNFLADMGEPKAGDSIDRIDPNGHYEPGNCRWATKLEQAANMRSNLWITFNGQRAILSEWSRRTGIKVATLSLRLRAGWSVERALTEPPRGS